MKIEGCLGCFGSNFIENQVKNSAVCLSEQLPVVEVSVAKNGKGNSVQPTLSHSDSDRYLPPGCHIVQHFHSLVHSKQADLHLSTPRFQQQPKSTHKPCPDSTTYI